MTEANEQHHVTTSTSKGYRDPVLHSWENVELTNNLYIMGSSTSIQSGWRRAFWNDYGAGVTDILLMGHASSTSSRKSALRLLKSEIY
ncbi:hypothetical protein T265_09340 [Opisthorchis viverrini]|uniref:Uncharacterized protein n=1 Tax=Opisthorchis viverrini TaxID=6198 RepID=A0A074ZAK8_OPIVI|nr:hypothetical protein T265_09340 [Opisthorchis viverrini]KER22607.1 hypothetical protein T265_09340 [Opisthorchis viverrini]